jgi:hypothetical protein
VGVPKAEWTRAHVAEVATRGPASLAILTQSLPENVQLTELLEAVDEDSLVLPTSRLIINCGSNRERERDLALYEAIRLSGAERGAPSLATALHVLQRVPTTVTTDHARAILETCLTLVEHPIDPYQAPHAGQEARLAAANLISAHPELDDLVLERLRQTESRNIHAVVAKGLAGRSLRRSEAIASAIQAMQPTSELAVEFGRRSDIRYSAHDPVHQAKGETGRIRLVGRRVVLTLQPTIPWLLGPLLLFLIGAAVQASDWATDIEFGTSELLGMLGVLVAVHVVSAELSSQRLPGTLARRTNTPWALRLAYSVLITLLFARALASGVVEADVIANLRSNEVAVAGAVIFGLLLYTSLKLLLARTDLSNAAERYSSARRNALERSGIKLGAIQGESAEASALISSLTFARQESSPSVAERRSKVIAKRRGFRRVRIRRLHSLSKISDWASGSLTLTFLMHPGTSAMPGEEIGSITAAPDSSVTPGAYRQGRRVFRVTRAGSIDEATEAAAALIDSAQVLAATGDAMSAQRVATAFRLVVGTHLKAARRGRTRSERKISNVGGPQYPSIPMVRVVVDSLMERLCNRASELEREILIEMISQLVDLSLPEEHSTYVIALKAGDVIAKADDEITGTSILASCAAAALDASDSRTLGQIQDTLKKTLQTSAGTTRPYVLESSSQIAAAAVWRDYFRSHEFWEWYWQATTKCEDMTRSRTLGALRIGAAAILAGNYSLAIRVATEISQETQLDGLEDWVRQQSVAAREQAVSHMFGRYLGSDAEASLREFVRFATEIESSIADGAD